MKQEEVEEEKEVDEMESDEEMEDEEKDENKIDGHLSEVKTGQHVVFRKKVCTMRNRNW